MSRMLVEAFELLKALAAQDKILASRICNAILDLEAQPTLGTRLPDENYWFYRNADFALHYQVNAATNSITISAITLL